MPDERLIVQTQRLSPTMVEVTVTVRGSDQRVRVQFNSESGPSASISGGVRRTPIVVVCGGQQADERWVVGTDDVAGEVPLAVSDVEGLPLGITMLPASASPVTVRCLGPEGGVRAELRHAPRRRRLLSGPVHRRTADYR